jgi:hypothetical protein
MAQGRFLIEGGRVKHLEVYRETDLLQHLADHSGLDLQSPWSNEGDRQAVAIPCLMEQVLRFVNIKRVRRQVGIIPEALRGEQRRSDHSISFGRISDEVSTIGGLSANQSLRHLLGLFAHQRVAKVWKRFLSAHIRPTARAASLLREVMPHLPDEILDASA